MTAATPWTSRAPAATLHLEGSYWPYLESAVAAWREDHQHGEPTGWSRPRLAGGD